MYIDFAWEYLKRNKEYVNDWNNYSKRTETMSEVIEKNNFAERKWGLLEFANPNLSAENNVFWSQAVSTRSARITLSKTGDIPASYILMNRNQFQNKILVLSDGSACVKVYNENSYFQFFLSASDLCENDIENKFVYISLNPNCFATIKRVMLFLLDGKYENSKKCEHAKSLRAYDKYLSGMTHRDIANEIYSEEARVNHWHSDSWLRAKVRYKIQRAKSMINGGYHGIL
ncbi:DUF2285 domain-containing protein [Lelliottia sp. SL45]|uniref:DNA -binding domain-containing protein n=1 Tax=Lelliottia sp. SL45 TaxID=2994665 RepID=UPI002276D115|nr:DUF2285 domain-containing protein [Lelliottia sp. SL45]MCY1700989.1 DUF2285 domain-containing protein [Lelliottia sp. SL45]